MLQKYVLCMLWLVCALLYGLLFTLTYDPHVARVMHEGIGLPSVLRKQLTAEATESLAGSTGSATPEVQLAVYWLHRIRTTPFREWYGGNLVTGDRASFPVDVVQEGRVVFPLYAAYLFAVGQWTYRVQGIVTAWLGMPVTPLDHWLTERNSTTFTGHDAQQAEWLLLPSAALLTLLILLVVGVPVVWFLMSNVSTLLLKALMAQMENGASNPTAGAADAAASSQSFELSHKLLLLHSRMTVIGSLTVHITAIVPAFHLEISTLHPVCLSSIAVISALTLLLHDDCQAHPAKGPAPETFYLEKPLLKQGQLVFYSARRGPTLTYLCTAMGLMTGAVLCHSPIIYFAPSVGLWLLTNAYQHAHRRILVRTAEEADKPAREVGYSCYLDKVLLNWCLSVVSVVAVGVTVTVFLPFCWRQISLTDLFRLVGPSYTEGRSPDNGSVPANAESYTSLTGSAELQPRCLTSPYERFTCTRPSSNLWLCTEYYGVRWTPLFEGIVQHFFAGSNMSLTQEGRIWFAHFSAIILVMANLVPVLTLLFYRVKKPYLTFLTPTELEAERLRQEQKCTDFYMRHRTNPRGKKINLTEEGSAPPEERARVVTTITRERYIVKQLVLSMWVFIISALASHMLILHSGPLTLSPVLSMAGVLAGVISAIAVARSDVHHGRLDGKKPTTATSFIPAAGSSVEAPGETMDQGGLSLASLITTTDADWVMVILLAVTLDSEALTLLSTPRPVLVGIVVLLCTQLFRRQWKLRRFFHWDMDRRLLSLSLLCASLCGIWGVIPSTSVAATLRSLFGSPHSFSHRHVRGAPDDAENKMLIPNLMSQSVVACGLLIGCLCHASMRVVTLALEAEEERFTPPGEEFRSLEKHLKGL